MYTNLSSFKFFLFLKGTRSSDELTRNAHNFFCAPFFVVDYFTEVVSSHRRARVHYTFRPQEARAVVMVSPSTANIVLEM